MRQRSSMRQRSQYLEFASLTALALFLSTGLRAHDEPMAVYSAASWNKEAPVAPNSVALVDGQFGESTTLAPDGDPQLELDTVTVEIEGSDGVTVKAALFSVEPKTQRILSPNIPAGSAHMTVKRGEESVADGTFQVQSVSPGLFSAAESGGGLADGQAEIVNLLQGARHSQDLAYFDDLNGVFRAVPQNLAGEGTVLFLKLRGTGIRFAAGLNVMVGGVAGPAGYRNEHGVSAGIDEVRIGPLPVQLVHSELADVVVTADGIAANTVQVSFTDSAGAWITFSNQISRLFQGHCQVCHHPGEVAPLSLMEYADAKDWAPAIKQAVEEGSMPPWKPVAGHGEFVGERRLTDEEIEMLVSWVDIGAPEGNPSDLPEPLAFDANWTLGEPDVILETPSYQPAPNASDDYRCFSVSLPDSITESKSIVGVEVRPGNRQIVHHLALYGDPVGQSAAKEVAIDDGKPGYQCFGSPGISYTAFTPGVESYVLGLWTPGTRPLVMPEGSGMYIRRGSRIAVQVHYHPDGTEQSDSTRIGVHPPTSEQRRMPRSSRWSTRNSRFRPERSGTWSRPSSGSRGKAAKPCLPHC